MISGAERQAIRSRSAGVRNPVKRLKAWDKLKALPPEAREALRDVMAELAAEAAPLANECWRKHKPPMALYWKWAAVYFGHIKKAIPR